MSAETVSADLAAELSTELGTTEETDTVAEEGGRIMPGQRCRITMSNPTDPAQPGESWVVRISNREYVLWDQTAPRKKWGTSREVPYLAQSFMAWAAARREGRLTLTFDQFTKECEDVSDVKDDEETDTVARPTQSAVGPGFS